MFGNLRVATQVTPASSPWLQLCTVRARQSSRRASVPLQATLSSKICPVPAPKYACVLAMGFIVENPSCLHTTLASGVPQKSSHTVPHVLALQISTRPSFGPLPPTNRRSPEAQP